MRSRARVAAGWIGLVLMLGAAAPAEQTVTVKLSDFAFAPDHLRLQAGVPVHLRLVNENGRGHSFSAPALFAASRFPLGGAPARGTVEVPGDATVDLTLIPGAPGRYRLTCTHFLHSLFGMGGTIEVVAAP